MLLTIMGPLSPPAELFALTTFNTSAADTINADVVKPNGGAGLDLSGDGYVVGVWDGGLVRDTHQEFVDAGQSRVTHIDQVNVNNGVDIVNHATHVAGTIAGDGTGNGEEGIAPGVQIRSRHWDNDLVELGQDAAAGLLQFSNHSYGVLSGWSLLQWPVGAGGANVFVDTFTSMQDNAIDEDVRFGQYDADSEELDGVLNQNPELLSVWAASNDRDDDFTGEFAIGGVPHFMRFLTNDPWGNVNNRFTGAGWYLVTDNQFTPAPGGDGNNGTGFDSLPGGEQNAKNNLVVGSVNSIIVDPIASNVIASSAFSSHGPTDDGRIKPDIVANGEDVLSSLATSDTAYAASDGTSMAAPGATGGAVLVAEHFANEFGLGGGTVPDAVTTKAVILHTATDAGTVGPDYQFGWGLLDVQRATEVISSSAALDGDLILEESYTGEVWEFGIATPQTGSDELRATIVWSDPAGTASNDFDNRNTRLVNDLDLQIVAYSGGTETIHHPWTLDVNTPNAAAVRNQRNSVDNVEQVLIDSPIANHEYIIRVSAPAGVTAQDFSIVVSGVRSGSVITNYVNNEIEPDSISTVTWLADTDAASDEYNLWHRDVIGGGAWTKVVVTGPQYTFSPALTAASNYRFQVGAKPASGNENAQLGVQRQVKIRPDTPQVTQGLHPTFTWDAVPGADSYTVQIRNRNTGQDIIDTTTQTSYQLAQPFSDAGRYQMWVAASNGTDQTAYSFSRNFDVVTFDLLQPDGPSFELRPQFTWEPVSWATSYRIYVKQSGDGTEGVFIDDTVAVANFTPSIDLPYLRNGSTAKYVWWVQPTGQNGVAGPWSERGDFNRRSRVLTPTGTTSDSTPTFTWQAVDQAVSYRLEVRNTAGQLILQVDLSGTTYTPTTALVAGDYRAWIRVTNAQGTNFWNEVDDVLDFSVVANNSELQLEQGAEFDLVFAQLTGDSAEWIDPIAPDSRARKDEGSARMMPDHYFDAVPRRKNVEEMVHEDAGVDQQRAQLSLAVGPDQSSFLFPRSFPDVVDSAIPADSRN